MKDIEPTLHMTDDIHRQIFLREDAVYVPCFRAMFTCIAAYTRKCTPLQPAPLSQSKVVLTMTFLTFNPNPTHFKPYLWQPS